MAIILCPECGKEISDKVKTCPSCGYPLRASRIKAHLSPQKIVAAVAAVAVIGSVGYIAHSNNVTASEEQFLEEVQSLSVSMLGTAADAEEVCNLTQQVWSDCIFENFSMDTIKYTTENGDGIHYHDDFNDALIQLFSDEEYIAKVSGIQRKQSDISVEMERIDIPSKEMQPFYDLLSEEYDIFLDFASFATNATGTLESYSEKFRQLDENFMGAYNKLDSKLTARESLTNE